MRLNGWMRIAILVSVFGWIGGAVSIYIVQMEKSGKSYVSMLSSIDDCERFNSRAQAQGRPTTKCFTREDIERLHEEGRAHSKQVALIVPTFFLVLGWIVLGIAYFSIRWVMGGFWAAGGKKS